MNSTIGPRDEQLLAAGARSAASVRSALLEGAATMNDFDRLEMEGAIG